MATINFKEITNATTVTDGTGYFDSIMDTLTIHIEAQHAKGRLKGTDYANVYLGAMQSAMTEAFQFAMQKQVIETQIDGALQDNANKVKQGLKLDADTALVDRQDSELQLNGVENRALTTAKTATETDKLVSTAKARDVQEAQRRLYERQILGFDDNKQIKAFDAQLNSWALLNSSGMINSISIPAVISDANLTATYNSLTSDTNEALL